MGGWYLGVTQLVGNSPKVLAIPQSRNYDAEPVQSVCPYFYHNIQFFHFYFLPSQFSTKTCK